MTYGLPRYIKRLITGLLFLIGLGVSLFSQTHITSNQNVYKQVVGGGLINTDFVVVNNLTDFNKFHPGDTVLIIQMKGVEISVTEDPTYGDFQQMVGSPGKYEFLIVMDTVSATRTIRFRNNLRNTYDPSGDVQLIRVPSYFNAIIDGTITCPNWDSTSTVKTGGVFAIIVNKTLTLNGDIDVSGKGYKGGVAVNGDGLCTSATSNQFSYDVSYTNSGLKGEGFVSWGGYNMIPGNYDKIYPYHAKGRGLNRIGGGGGSGKYAGGGGGSNIGNGGIGGKEMLTCISPTRGGNQLANGSILGSSLDGGRLFMGGGGGGSTSITAGAGGNGGGIVIIICGEINGQGHSIIANGLDGGAGTGVSGSGGGGAGGTIALYLETLTNASNLTMIANGGKGGSNPNTYGEGAGGGGGRIWTSRSMPASQVVRNFFGGIRGSGGSATAGPGTVGDSLINFVPVLNGFLFNTIRSSETGTLVDSTCSNMIPYPVLGTTPVGGSGNYTYLWQKRKKGTLAWNSIASSNVMNYSFIATEADSFQIRRIVSDDVTSLSDSSKQADIYVQAKILNNTVKIYSDIISLTDTVCFGQDPKLIDQVLPDLIIPTSKPGAYHYSWQDSTQTNIWGTALGSSKNYDPNPPGGLQKDTWYRRTVYSGRCIDSTAKVKFTVIPVIQNNVVSAAQEICHGGAFTDLAQASGPALSGGYNTYRYQWQISPTGTGSWSNATGTSNTTGYNPPESGSDTEVKSYFRRMVYSGSNNVCRDSSSSLLLTEWKKISNNLILSADQTICSGSTPSAVTASLPADGNHSYSYSWRMKGVSGSFLPADGANSLQDYQPSSRTDTTWYRRYVTSSICIDSSNVIVVNVHKPVLNNTIGLPSSVTDTTICANQLVPLIKGVMPSGGTNNLADTVFKWEYSSPGNSSWSSASGTSDMNNYKTGNLANGATSPLNYYYRRNFTSGKCSSVSNTVTVKVLGKITNNTITADQAVCYNTLPAALSGTALSGGDPGLLTWKWQQSTNGGSTWSNASGTVDQQNYSPSALSVPTSYRRWIYSGLSNCCVDSSNVVNISINPRPIGTITPATDTICEGTIKPFSLAITGSTSSPWSVTYRETYLRNNTFTPTTVSQAVASSTVNVTPLISSATTDSAAYSYTISNITDSKGCVATSLTGTRKLIIYKLPAPNSYADTSVCGPTAILKGAMNVGKGRWFYSSVPAVDSVLSGNTLTVTVDSTLAGTSWPYTFTWHVLNWNCTASDQKVVTFDKRATQASIGKDSTIYTQTDQFQLPIQALQSYETGTWFTYPGGIAITDGLLTGLGPGEFFYEWRVVNGACQSSDLWKLTINNIFVPDGFSPNGDNTNDTFEILGLDPSKSEVTVTILNSAGAQVYNSSNANGGTYVPWNGENEKGALPDGIYYYIVRIKTTTPSTLFEKTGYVVVKRDY